MTGLRHARLLAVLDHMIGDPGLPDGTENPDTRPSVLNIFSHPARFKRDAKQGRAAFLPLCNSVRLLVFWTSHWETDIKIEGVNILVELFLRIAVSYPNPPP